MLEDCKELSPSSRWRQSPYSNMMNVLKLLSELKTVRTFLKIMWRNLRKREHVKALEEQKRNRVEYLEFLKACDFIKASSQWRKIQDHLETDERCSRLEKIDRLEIFQEYIRDLESEEEEQRKLRMIKDFAVYLVVSSNTSGSTAKDLFTDVMDELEKQEITASSKWEDCKSLFEDRIMGGEGLLLEIFNKFVNELKEKERKRQEDKNFTDLSKSPHGHSKKVHPKKSGRDSSRVPVLIQTIRRLTKEKVQMASEVSSMLRNQVAERNELQSVLEKELDRRSSDWSLKLKKYQIEQHRLRERERELAEQNVSLQREVSSFNEKEVDNRIKMSFSEKPLEDLSKRMEQVSEENQNLRQQFTQLQAKYRVAQENRDYVRENY
ncbi:hypothetical protein P3S67_032574 [Capsicum chacoense]